MGEKELEIERQRERERLRERKKRRNIQIRDLFHIVLYLYFINITYRSVVI